jgi:predicted nucleotidyltransferase
MERESDGCRLKLLKPKVQAIVYEYIRLLRKNNIPVFSLCLFGSHAKGAAHGQSDIDLAVFWDKDEIDGYNVMVHDLTAIVFPDNVAFPDGGGV